MQFDFCPRQGQGSEHNPKKIQVAKIHSSKLSLHWSYILLKGITIRENYSVPEYQESAATGPLFYYCHQTRNVAVYLREGG